MLFVNLPLQKARNSLAPTKHVAPQNTSSSLISYRSPSSNHTSSFFINRGIISSKSSNIICAKNNISLTCVSRSSGFYVFLGDFHSTRFNRHPGAVLGGGGGRISCYYGSPRRFFKNTISFASGIRSSEDSHRRPYHSFLSCGLWSRDQRWIHPLVMLPNPRSLFHVSALRTPGP